MRQLLLLALCLSACDEPVASPHDGPAPGSADGSTAAPDSGADLAAPLAADLRPTDAQAATPDAGTSSFCAPGIKQNSEVRDGAMAYCLNSQPITQCQAASLCAAAAHLCTASEYLSHGGKTQPFGIAWLASCIRDGSDAVSAPPLTSPTDSICGGCETSATSFSAIPVSWDRSGGPEKYSFYKRVGAVSRNGWTPCRVGKNDDDHLAFWSARPSANVGASHDLVWGAACCR